MPWVTDRIQQDRLNLFYFYDENQTRNYFDLSFGFTALLREFGCRKLIADID